MVFVDPDGMEADSVKEDKLKSFFSDNWEGAWASADVQEAEYKRAFANFGGKYDRDNEDDNDFRPDKNGNLIVEEGDTAEKLLDEYGVVVTDKNFKFEKGNVILLDNNMTESIAESNKTNTYNEKTDCYNCHGAAIAVVTGKSVNPKTAGFKDLANPTDSEIKQLKNNLKPVSSSQAVHGKTILSFGDHSAVYYGTDNGGTQYYYSKNGATQKPGIFTLQQLKTFYPSNPNPKLLNYAP